MKYLMTIVLSMGLILGTPLILLAHPPASIELQYDKDKQTLQVNIKHVVRNSRKHFIKKLEIIKNQEPPAEQFNHSQKSASEDQLEVPLALQGGDTVTVKAFCIEGGSAEATLSIPVEDEDEKKK